MKILAIGNSFSQDATRYLREIAKSNGDDYKVINLYIPACPLRKHYLNILTQKEQYEIEVDGMSTGFTTSIQKALASDRWDVVTLQQGSKNSFNYQNYQPYLDLIKNTVKTYCLEAKIYVHQTWSYEDGSSLLPEFTPYITSAEMFKDVRTCYAKMAKQINADGVILSGELVQMMLEKGLTPIYRRDGQHLSLGVGRYATALLWYATLTGKEVTDISFNYFDEEISDEYIKIIKQLVNGLVNKGVSI